MKLVTAQTTHSTLWKLCSPKDYYHVHNCNPTVPNLGHRNPVHTILLCED